MFMVEKADNTEKCKAEKLFKIYNVYKCHYFCNFPKFIFPFKNIL